MEKRIILAFVLCYVVIFFWFPKSSKNNVEEPQKEITQTIETKEVVDSGALLAQNESLSFNSSILKAQEKNFTLENSDVALEFSNIGGNLTSISLTKYKKSLPLTQMFSVDGFETSVFNAVIAEKNRLVLSHQNDALSIVKEFVLEADKNLLKTSIKIVPKANIGENFKNDVSAFSLDITRLDKNIVKSRDRNFLEYSVFYDDKIVRKAGAYKFQEKEKKSISGKIDLIGFRTRYFCVITRPLFDSLGAQVDPEGEKNLSIALKVDGLLGEENKFVTYVGPQDLSQLKKYGYGFEKIMVFFRIGFFDMIAKGIYWLLNFLHKLVPSWGLNIIMISILIYGAMYPLTMKSMLSMRKMQTLQPKMNKLREQHKNNPQKLNKEMMELYKVHKINPLGGCLPIFVQMPVFIGLYQVLWRSFVFKGAGFLWIKDLAEPDRLIIMSTYLPFIGNEINILPIIMMIAMFFQQKLTSKNMASGDPAQAAQQKMMLFFFPVFLGFIFYKFASGLCLYFTMFYIFSSLTQLKMSKKKKVA